MNAESAARYPVTPVGIDLGTSYSCLAFLNRQGEPQTLPNAEGELATPSVVFFDGQNIVVGTEALRQSVARPERVVANAKRFLGDPHKCWQIDGKIYRPQEISAMILKKLLSAAEEQLGRIQYAVITVPEQFSEVQRQQTSAAALQAGLQRVDIINEPTAAALCHVLGEGMWFVELAEDQTTLVFDLGGGTLDLALVQYRRNHLKVIATGGDLQLGGWDWNQLLQEYLCARFEKETGTNPQSDPESLQALVLDVEHLKRSLSMRPHSTVVVQHAGHRKSFTIERSDFERQAQPLVKRAEQCVLRLLKEQNMGWARIHSVLITGGASRMPMIREMLQRISGTTPNRTLSPDQSICHGAAYRAGMLLENGNRNASTLNQQAAARLGAFRQKSVSGRALGILVREPSTGQKRPQYLIPVNSPLPVAYKQRFGTVVPHQRKVQITIVESGVSPQEPYVELGELVIDGFAADLPESSPVEVIIRYNEQARLQVSAEEVVSGTLANTTLIRPLPQMAVPAPSKKTFQPAAGKTAAPPPKQRAERSQSEHAAPKPEKSSRRESANPHSPDAPASAPRSAAPSFSEVLSLDDAESPVPLCPVCGEPLNQQNRCPQGHAAPEAHPRTPRSAKSMPTVPSEPHSEDHRILSDSEIPEFRISSLDEDAAR